MRRCSRVLLVIVRNERHIRIVRGGSVVFAVIACTVTSVLAMLPVMVVLPHVIRLAERGLVLRVMALIAALTVPVVAGRQSVGIRAAIGGVVFRVMTGRSPVGVVGTRRGFMMLAVASSAAMLV